jgi:hypothetical protein
MKVLIAVVAVRVRGWWHALLGRSDRTGLTVPCNGCSDPWPHDAHLARGALTYLGRKAWR